nr:hypothetical protein [uncultured bacterium]
MTLRHLALPCLRIPAPHWNAVRPLGACFIGKEIVDIMPE